MLEVIAGTAVTTTATFTVGGVTTDPTTVTLKFRSGGAATTTWTYGGGQITKSSTGVYTATLDTTLGASGTVGLWTVQWAGTGAAAIVQNTQFMVDSPAI